MAEAAIPVDLSNPGQVFACLGFLEAADALVGDAEGGFDWSDEADVRFSLWPAGHSQGSVCSEEFPTRLKSLWDSQDKKWKRSALPIQVRWRENRVVLDHWVDGSSRNAFKL